MRVIIGPYRNYNKRTKTQLKRKISVRIDKWDTWSMDSTLAMIIVPMLKQLKKTTHGAPDTDVEDSPKNLRPTPKQVEIYKEKGETDPKFFERWNWILDEMIWAFSQVNTDWEMEFSSGKSDHRFIPMDKDGKEIGKPVKLSDKRKEPEGAVSWRMVKGPNDTYKIDRIGRDKHWNRMKNGFRLFGKYYSNLWD
jgi:hypothetical protein